MGSRIPPPTFAEELALHAQGYSPIAGIDEVGRGPLAGPLVAAALVLPPHYHLPWLASVRDSKQLTPRQRENLFSHIQEAGLAWGTGSVSPAEVDSRGIVAATKKAMLMAVERLPQRPAFLLIDALPLPEAGMPFKAIIKGDERCLSIAAASIVAKVTRDRMMEEEDLRYPGYGFAGHKGYHTEAHLENLRRLGLSPIHRRSFAPVKAIEDGNLAESPHNKRLGDAGEMAARGYLQGKGYTILETNFRSPYGEVDVVAQEGDCLVFVEVRTRAGNDFGRPEESITPSKERRLIATAETYIQSRPGLPSQWRIDLVAVEVDRRGRIKRIEQTENAVSYLP
ncbi:MAG: rnhB [Dehalococcoidia bacterium]|nr:rnhB [Dehalococcoidia bacterium]